MGGWTHLSAKSAEIRKLQANIDILLKQIVELQETIDRVIKGELRAIDGMLAVTSAVPVFLSSDADDASHVDDKQDGDSD